MTYAFPLPIPVLETDRLILREPREADFTAALAFNDSPRNVFVGGMLERRWIWRGVLANIGHWALRGYGFFSVDTKAGDFIGRVGVIYHDGWDEPELGWHLFDGFEGKGYPNLLDNDWLWGGDLDSIHTTITHGIRNTTDADARYSEMPKFGADELLDGTQIGQVVEHVLALSGQEHDAALATEGAVVYADNCSACHAEDGSGDRAQGAPNLTDAIWLYGGTREAITETVTYARFGVMPNWNQRLSEDEIRAVAFYVHTRGGGE